ncbi:RNase P modulator RnpM [Alicyclobacillus acidiphilus]|uniref:RNase P modulator RnpM n=1 Tax=Alicyclobacillus acidiphilus TaxID=182455 RepID=UPI0008320DFB|nr:YlxR family protein [Alicyclobacillus acidiphilus]
MNKVRKIPLRKCVGCQEMKPKRELIRVVHTPDGDVLIDPTGKQNGRGAYLCPDETCLQTAQKKKSLERALKMSIPSSVYETLTVQLQGAMNH